MTDINPCPYCKFKSTALIVESQELEYYRPVSYAYVYCGECFARGRAVHELEDGSYRDAAISAWNDVATRCGEKLLKDSDLYDKLREFYGESANG